MAGRGGKAEAKDVCIEHDCGLVDPLNTFAKTEMSHDGRAPA